MKKAGHMVSPEFDAMGLSKKTRGRESEETRMLLLFAPDANLLLSLFSCLFLCLQVPYDKPREALEMLTRYLNGEKL